MVSKNINQLIIKALKEGDKLRLSTLRMLSSALNYEKIEKRHELTEEEELAVIRKQAKQRKDSIESYNKAGATDRAKKEEEELKVLMEFLPAEMTDEELVNLVNKAIDETGAKGMKDIGKVIGMIKSKAPNVEGGRIAELVKQKLEVKI